MLPRAVLLCLILPTASLRVQQRGADVKVSPNGALELKEKDQAAVSAPVSDAALAWAKGAGPIYAMSLTDWLRIVQWEVLHPFRCFQGWSPAATGTSAPNHLWGDSYDPTPPTYASNTLDPNNPNLYIGAKTFTDSVNCLLNNPVKWKAIADPLDFHSHSAGNAWQQALRATRWLDPFHIFDNWSFGDDMWRFGAPAIIKRWNVATGSYNAGSCDGAPDYTYIFYIAREDDNGNPVNTDVGELLEGDSMIMSTANGNRDAGGDFSWQYAVYTGSFCYVRNRYPSLSGDIDETKYVKCSCNYLAASTNSVAFQSNGSQPRCRVYQEYGDCMQNQDQNTVSGERQVAYAGGIQHCADFTTGSTDYNRALEKNFISHTCGSR